MRDMAQGEQDLIMPTKSHYKKYKYSRQQGLDITVGNIKWALYSAV